MCVTVQSGYTPLHLAAQEGHVEMLSLLLGPAGNVEVNSQAMNGLAALHLAAQENHLPIAHVLLEHSCIVDPQTKVNRLSSNISPKQLYRHRSAQIQSVHCAW